MHIVVVGQRVVMVGLCWWTNLWGFGSRGTLVVEGNLLLSAGSGLAVNHSLGLVVC